MGNVLFLSKIKVNQDCNIKKIRDRSYYCALIRTGTRFDILSLISCSYVEGPGEFVPQSGMVLAKITEVCGVKKN